MPPAEPLYRFCGKPVALDDALGGFWGALVNVTSEIQDTAQCLVACQFSSATASELVTSLRPGLDKSSGLEQPWH